MVFSQFSSAEDQVDAANEDSSSTERTGLLASMADLAGPSLPRTATPTASGATATGTTTSAAAAAAASTTTTSLSISFLGADNIATYGSIASNSRRRSSNNNSNSNSHAHTTSSSSSTDEFRILVDTLTPNASEDAEALGALIPDGLERAADFFDVEEGATAPAEALGPSWESLRDDSSSSRRSAVPPPTTNNNNNNHNNPNDAQPLPAAPASPTRDGAIGHITRRLRCLFSTITFPIVPLGTIVSLALLWVLYAATSLDLRKSCSHPLHSYSFLSVLLVAYIPNHSQVRSQLFSYSRERDGPIRPARVRLYDQFFHTICLLYVYTGVTLIQTCRDDVVPVTPGTSYAELEAYALPTDGLPVLGFDADPAMASALASAAAAGVPLNSCEATCPNLYEALSVYVATLELFTFALILPLLFLPCIYLWFLQRATAEADAFSRLQDRLQEEDALSSNGGVTTGEILENLDTVRIVSSWSAPNPTTLKPQTTAKTGSGGGTPTRAAEQSVASAPPPPATTTATEEPTCYIVPDDHKVSLYTVGTVCRTKECCICMTEFDIRRLPPRTKESESSSSSALANSDSPDEALEDAQNDEEESRPLVSAESSATPHKSLSPWSLSPSKEEPDAEEADAESSTIVRTRCGHLFHKECLKGWVGGMWSANTNTSSYRIDNSDRQDWRKRKARQIHCPLCREDLRPMTYTAAAAP